MVTVKQFDEAVQSRNLRVGIIGRGYVGLPMALALVHAGYHVTGIDLNKKRIALLASGVSPIGSISDVTVGAHIASGKLTVTCDYSMSTQCQVILICVPTPLGEHREPDMSFVVGAARGLRHYLQAGQMIVLESTVYPGTTEGLLASEIDNGSLQEGTDFFLVYSPEREDPGNTSFTTHTIPKLVSGVSVEGARRARLFYESFVDSVVPVSSTKEAEMAKLLENIFRCVNIALVNELKMICQKMEIDIWEVIRAASSKPFGFMPFHPGPGLGGHRIPIDPFYLAWQARAFKLNARFIELAGEVNASMPQYVVSRLSEALNDAKIALNGAKILLLGVVYKKDIDDAREAPALRIYELLDKQGAEVSFYDPKVSKAVKTSRFKALTSIEASGLEAFDAVVIVTDHSEIDYASVVRQARLVVDTRNATRNVTCNRQKIVLA